MTVTVSKEKILIAPKEVHCLPIVQWQIELEPSHE